MGRNEILRGNHVDWGESRGGGGYGIDWTGAHVDARVQMVMECRLIMVYS